MSTLHTSEKTHQAVLPQRLALESVSADNPGVGTKRGTDADPSATGVQHGRGETPEGLTCPLGRHVVSDDDRDRKIPSPATLRVGVLDRSGKPLMPCHPARARKLLESKRAVVANFSPFVIRLKDRKLEDSVVQGLEEGIDPGSKYTGVSLFRVDDENARHGLFAVQVNHRGQLIHKNMGQRASLRRGRRSRNLRYRSPRFNNRTKPKGWLPPSLQHRVNGIISMHCKLARWFSITSVRQELVRFDTQKMENPEISGAEYQQGTLAGFEVREYLLAKWDRKCAYCGAEGTGPNGVPLNIDHIHPKSQGGTNRVSNLALACIKCNQKKNALPVQEFLKRDPARLRRVLAQAKAPLRDAAAVNSTRWSLFHKLGAMGLKVQASSAAYTKWNRSQNHLPKSHTLDALCVGEDVRVKCYPASTQVADSAGRGAYARTSSDKYGFPRLHLTRQKRHFGFATGDLVKANVPKGKTAGVHLGRVAVRSRGSFNIRTAAGLVQDVNHRHCRLLQRADGWSWSVRPERIPEVA